MFFFVAINNNNIYDVLCTLITLYENNKIKLLILNKIIIFFGYAIFPNKAL